MPTGTQISFHLPSEFQGQPQKDPLGTPLALYSIYSRNTPKPSKTNAAWSRAAERLPPVHINASSRSAAAGGKRPPPLSAAVASWTPEGVARVFFLREGRA